MKPCISFVAVLAMFCVFLVPTSVAASPASATKVDVDLHQHPTGGKTPVEVSVGLYVTNLVAIDETRETFEVGGYLIGVWQDPRLALPVDARSEQTGSSTASVTTPRTFRVEDIWTPPIEAANSVSHKTNSYLLEADRTGKVTYVERFDAVLSNEYALRKFPFDTQVLRFEFQPFLSAASGIQFAAQALPSTGISPEQHTELAAWQIKDLRYTTEKVAGNSFVPAIAGGVIPDCHRAQVGFLSMESFPAPADPDHDSGTGLLDRCKGVRLDIESPNDHAAVHGRL